MLRAEVHRSERNASVLSLSDVRSMDVDLVGAKAAALASALVAGLPAVPGYVLTTTAAAGLESAGAAPPEIATELRAAWEELSDFGGRPLAVRSSSSMEDTAESSMAGMFVSVIGVGMLDEMLNAVDSVIASGRRLGAPIAVLIQPLIDASCAGVMFTLDPLTGHRDRFVVAAVDGSPEPLVSGRVDGARYVLKPDGAVIRADDSSLSVPLVRSRRKALTRLGSDAHRAFGVDQDIEWAFDRTGDLWMLQSRPITAHGDAAEAQGPIFGPGSIAETFPQPLSLLEHDLWAEPMKVGIGEALVVAGAASRRRVAASPIIRSVNGRLAIDLSLVGGLPRRSLWMTIDPRPGLRRLAASWRVGRLRAALPAIAADVVNHVDEQLGQVPEFHSLEDEQLLVMLDRTRRTLLSLTGHEVLCGLLLTKGATTTAAASHALAALSRAREQGLPDDEIVGAEPETLMLIPPRIGARPSFPAVISSDVMLILDADPLATARESLKMTIRWVQELGARVAEELGRRLSRRGLLRSGGLVRWLTFAELIALVEDAVVPIALDDRVSDQIQAPLPTAFRLSPSGLVVAEKLAIADGGQGVSSGRVTATVAHDGVRATGQVLVVASLDPRLAGVLPGLGGLVSETGSALSHLAILAREYGIPTVVGVADAVGRFPAGSVIAVDGTSGTVDSVGDMEVVS